jgi:CheY-like chemotaxis protein
MPAGQGLAGGFPLAAETGKTVLVVEDNDVVREGLAVLLRREGYAVALARHGREALDYLRAAPSPCLVLLDMMLPVLDGWQFLVRHRAGATASPVVIVTALGAATPEWAAGLGAVGLLRKLVETEDLLKMVRRWCPGCTTNGAGACPPSTSSTSPTTSQTGGTPQVASTPHSPGLRRARRSRSRDSSTLG